VSIDGGYTSKIFDTNQSVVLGDQYKLALTRHRVTCRRYIIPLFRRRPAGLRKPVYKRNEEKETKNETIILRTHSHELISLTTDWYAQWRPFGSFGAQGNSPTIGKWLNLANTIILGRNPIKREQKEMKKQSTMKCPNCFCVLRTSARDSILLLP
jgi:hypothetical protein